MIRVGVVGPVWFSRLPEQAARAFQSLGCEARAMEWSPPGRPSAIPGLANWRRRRTLAACARSLQDELARFRPDVVTVFGGFAGVPPREVMELLRRTVRAWYAIWLGDDPSRSGELMRALHAFDAVYSSQPGWIPRITLTTGHRVAYMIGGADPTVYRPLDHAGMSPSADDGALAFVGAANWDGGGVLRARVLDAVADRPLAIYGNPAWGRLLTDYPRLRPHFRGRTLAPEAVNELYNRASLVFSIHHPQFRAGASMMTLEIAASGACGLIPYGEGLDAVFVPGREYLVFRTLGELREMAGYYADHPESRREIGRAARARVLAEHTLAHRCRRILDDAAAGRAAG